MSVTGGVAVTLVGWWLSGRLFGLYIAKIANYTATYAGLASFVILMFFLYIQAIIFLYGAELNRSIADFRGAPLCRQEHSGSKPAPGRAPNPVAPSRSLRKRSPAPPCSRPASIRRGSRPTARRAPGRSPAAFRRPRDRNRA